MLGWRIEAIVEFKKALALCSEFSDVHVKLAEIYRLRGRFGKAREHLETVLTQRADYAPARVLLGVILLAQGHHELATRPRKRACKHDCATLLASSW